MTAATREKVLAALEQACREEAASVWKTDLVDEAHTDEGCAPLGAGTTRIIELSEPQGSHPRTTRRVLDAEVAAGRVLRHKADGRGLIRWWPVGLLDKLQAERASAGMRTYCLGYTHAKCAACQHERNWGVLNEMPDAERLPLQVTMTRIDSDKCRMTNMGEHAPVIAGDAS
jgi:hypothetical protein